MYRLIIFFLLFSISLIAYSDMDMDGVEDKDDKCPNTPLTDLVDLTGCTIKSLKSPHHFDISLGGKYMQKSDVEIYNSTFQMDYYYKNLSLQLSGSYFTREIDGEEESGANDTYLNGYWKFKPSQNLSIRVGGGVSIPTYDSENNKLDYTLATYFTYRYSNLSLLGGVGKTFIGDSDTEQTDYTNPIFYSLGLGYYFGNSLYSSLSYSDSSSIYNSMDNIQTLSLYNYYKFDENWFLNLSYSYGLDDKGMQHNIGVALGYYW